MKPLKIANATPGSLGQQELMRQIVDMFKRRLPSAKAFGDDDITDTFKARGDESNEVTTAVRAALRVLESAGTLTGSFHRGRGGLKLGEFVVIPDAEWALQVSYSRRLQDYIRRAPDFPIEGVEALLDRVLRDLSARRASAKAKIMAGRKTKSAAYAASLRAGLERDFPSFPQDLRDATASYHELDDLLAEYAKQHSPALSLARRRLN